MRILVITNLYPPHAYGGYENLCAGAVAAWHQAGHTVEVLTSAHRRPDVPETVPGDVPVHRTLPIYWDGHRVLDVPLRTAWRGERRLAGILADALAAADPDVVSVWNAAALPISLFERLADRRLPTGVVVGDRWLGFAPRQDAWARRFAHSPLRLLAPAVTRLTGIPTRPGRLGADHVVCFASEHLRTHARERGAWGLRRTALVPHGLDTSRYPVGEPGDQTRPWRGRLLYAGRIAPEKGVATAIEALAELGGCRLDLLGDGDAAYRDELSALADRLGVHDRVGAPHRAGPDELRSAYQAADALLFPSAWPEPFGIVPLEAMACGLPVVATGTGGSGEFLLDGVTALRFPPGDAGRLADQVRRLAADAGLRARLSAAGTRVATWLDRRRTFDDLLTWHRLLAGEAVSPPDDRALLPGDLRGQDDVAAETSSGP